MTALFAAQILALGLIVAGLVGVVLEIALKSPRAFAEIASDSEAFALSAPKSFARTAKIVPAREIANANAPTERQRDAA